MTKNVLVEDVKPKNELVVDIRPQNDAVSDVKPFNLSVGGDFGADRLYEVVLGAGMYMGIPLLTYPTAGTVMSSFSP